MRNLLWITVLGVGAVAGVANAEVTSTVYAVSDYDFRGQSQSATDPALQASIDYVQEASGLFVGAWASNIDFGPDSDAKIEVDVYGGFTGSFTEALGWELGAYYYGYPQDDEFSYAEIGAGLSYGWVKGKLWYASDFNGDSTPGDTSSTYIEGNLTVPLDRVSKGLTLQLHAGLSTGEYWDDIYGDDLVDYSVGLGYTLGSFNLNLKYLDTDSDVRTRDDLFNNEGRVLFTVSTTFPWAK
jgi:uncharacterized protein (TIGR02001 family)